ncbi:transcription elongation factor GreB [Methylicorpusculum sp.]|uniref:transcription elongation factor GreB n=1 Tax=Methylicorpusculum sp. TaxID=2713644 RepID=UPI00273188E6|nr:transcription elongation factor GreB [Methylicorpusculum sp.]MDP2179787.1 transcription elongation factor GreB [Methylicorpusculum sp.]MDP3528474.1 transcription elongation factor GreB [Methylicorpusculum sp.]MDZ4150382.1 transcription elongation factor GreB [Methylicorpusculum sp.]
MSRWKPPQAKSSPYITQAGYQALENELRALWDKRKDVTAALSAAAAEGDRSENAEYIYRKKELRGIDRRIHYLQKRLPSLTVVSQAPSDQDKIFFGAWVTLENESGEPVTYRIVGADELNPAKNYISLDSPLAKVLLKKTFDDEVTIFIEQKPVRYTVLDIAYSQ